MCWSMEVTVAMVAVGSAATVVTLRRGDPPAIPATIAWFTLMEALQVAGHATLDRCSSPSNQVVALLSYLHIAFQPFFVNAFAMALLARDLRAPARVFVWICCGTSAVVMLLQVFPFDWAGSCPAGSVLCGRPLCVVSGDWHLAWNIPANDLLAPLRGIHWALGGYPTYMATAFLLPLAYGAWRFVLWHALSGPILAWQLTSNPNEMPAIWCLFAIGIVLVALSPAIRSRIGGTGWAALTRPRAAAA